MYLGFMLLLLSATAASGRITGGLAIAAFYLLCVRWYIPFEERAAEEAFGTAYLTYKKQTPRWWGPPRKDSDSLDDHA